jgi:hypothetical protein
VTLRRAFEGLLAALKNSLARFSKSAVYVDISRSLPIAGGARLTLKASGRLLCSVTSKMRSASTRDHRLPSIGLASFSRKPVFEDDSKAHYECSPIGIFETSPKHNLAAKCCKAIIVSLSASDADRQSAARSAD